MNNRHYDLIVHPILRPTVETPENRAPVSVGAVVRTAEGTFIRNFVLVGDYLPCTMFCDAVLTGQTAEEGEFRLEELPLHLISNLSRDFIINRDDDRNGDPDPEIRAYADVFVKLPAQVPDKLTVRLELRFGTEGVSVRAEREDTGENLETRIEQH